MLFYFLFSLEILILHIMLRLLESSIEIFLDALDLVRVFIISSWLPFISPIFHNIFSI